MLNKLVADKGVQSVGNPTYKIMRSSQICLVVLLVVLVVKGDFCFQHLTVSFKC